MAIKYNRVNWVNGQAGGTATSAANFNIMDEAIAGLAAVALGEVELYIDTANGNDLTGTINDSTRPYKTLHYVLDNLPIAAIVNVFVRGNATVDHVHTVHNTYVTFYPWDTTVDTEATIDTYNVSFGLGAELSTKGSAAIHFHIHTNLSAADNIIINPNGALLFSNHLPIGPVPGNGIAKIAAVEGVLECVGFKGANTSVTYELVDLKGVQHQYKLHSNATLNASIDELNVTPTLINGIVPISETFTKLFIGVKRTNIGGEWMVSNALSSLAMDPLVVT